DRLLWSDPPQADWPKSLRVAQNDWIGKSEGAIVRFGDLEVFTTRLDTIFGVTFVVVSPEHLFVEKLKSQEIKEYVQKAKKKSELERKENKEKTGVFSGEYVKNPLTMEDVPVWVADYVLVGYGTGAVMGVPAHDKRDFEFAKKFNLSIKRVIKGEDLPYGGEGTLVDSGKYTGMTSAQARQEIPGKKQVQYHLHDWSISRQRYWGTPIPIIHCDKCGTVPVPEQDLPVELPYEVDYTPQGKPPLATVEDWVNVSCPKCRGKAKREVETMDGFVDNSWYFYRYLDRKNKKDIFNRKTVRNWMPLDIYIGGTEHIVGHTLYSRFFTKFFRDLGLVPFDEYALKRVNHGVILGPDGLRMSKSRGNVVNPDEEVKKYGTDAIRLYLMFLGPYDIVTSWNPDGVNGVYHFLQRVWGLQEKVTAGPRRGGLQVTGEDPRIMHKTIKKVTEDIEQLKFNTAIASLMEWLNHLSRKEKISVDEYKTYLFLLAPFAPHITEELWSYFVRQRRTSRDKQWSIHQQSWPKSDKKYLEEEEFFIAVQINGKVRDVLVIQKDIKSHKEVIEKMALGSQKAKKFLEGKSVKKSVYVPGKIISFVVS
ncbi:MAG: class I tRNA ligase family protein, partial [Candidatus Daviesbacteria bacterium]|nr:class I tRNA ligase family protein [Candidatus Daviesbacteria bacterium]